MTSFENIFYQISQVAKLAFRWEPLFKFAFYPFLHLNEAKICETSANQVQKGENSEKAIFQLVNVKSYNISLWINISSLES